MYHEENTLQNSSSLAACICERREEEEEEERGRVGLFMQQNWHRWEAVKAAERELQLHFCSFFTAGYAGPASAWQMVLAASSAARICARSCKCWDAEHTCWLKVMRKTRGQDAAAVAGTLAAILCQLCSTGFACGPGTTRWSSTNQIKSFTTPM